MRNEQDCLASCVAYVTGENIEEMPHRVHATFNGDYMSDVWTQWLQERGYKYRIRDEHYKNLHIAIYCVLGQDIGHAVVMKRDRILYDPYPNLPMTHTSHTIKIWRDRHAFQKL